MEILEVKDNVPTSDCIMYNETYKIYYIQLGSLYFDDEVAEALDLSVNEYLKILKKHGARIDTDDGEYSFRKEESAKAAIKELEPRIILSKLRGN